MTRGTTPTISIKVTTNLDLSTIAKLWVTIEQKELQKTFELEDVEVDATNHKINVYMSQEDTLAFTSGYANLQLRGLTNDEKAFASTIAKIDVNRILKEGVI